MTNTTGKVLAHPCVHVTRCRHTQRLGINCITCYAPCTSLVCEVLPTGIYYLSCVRVVYPKCVYLLAVKNYINIIRRAIGGYYTRTTLYDIVYLSGSTSYGCCVHHTTSKSRLRPKRIPVMSRNPVVVLYVLHQHVHMQRNISLLAYTIHTQWVPADIGNFITIHTLHVR